MDASCEKIRIASMKLKLPQSSLCSAIVYFRKVCSFLKIDNEEAAQGRRSAVASACILVASKATENIRRTRDIINVFHDLQHDEPFLLHMDSEVFWKCKEQLVEDEQIVLRCLDFDLEVVLPHPYALNYIKLLDLQGRLDVIKLSLSFLNDSFMTSLCLSCDPHILALASLYFALKTIQGKRSDILEDDCDDYDDEIDIPANSESEVNSVPKDDWFNTFSVTEYALRKVCTEMKSFYSR